MKTVYKFYISSNVIERLALNTSIMLNNNRLYAWTDKKNLAEEFMMTRNMDSLELIKTKMQDDEIVLYGNQNRSKELSLNSFLHKENKYNMSSWERIKVVTTFEEKESVDIMIDGGLEASEAVAPYKFFQQKYIDKLNMLEYTKLHDIYFDEQDDYSTPNFMFDEYMVLLDVASITMSNF